MTLYPGAVVRLMPGSSTRPLRRKGRGVGFHVAVHRGPSIYDINLSTGNDAHLYVRADGTVEQNVDLDRQAWAGRDGNTSMIWVETEGGADPATVNSEPWTPQQVATLAAIAAWAHDTEGVPLQVMPNSLAASRGIGTHRLGIDPYRVSGGELWSSSYAKACPGDAKVAQVPGIVQTALQGADMPLTAQDLTNIAAAVVNRQIDGTTQLWVVLRDLHQQLPAIAKAVAAIPTSPAPVDPKALAAAIVAALPAAQAQQVVDELGKRLNTPAA